MSCRKLRRTSSQRKAILRDITTDLTINKRIVTTGARAKEIRSTVERIITLGKRGDFHARRQAAIFVRNEVASACEENESIVIESVLQELFNDLGPRFAEHRDGYARILETEPKRGDVAPMAVIEFVK